MRKADQDVQRRRWLAGALLLGLGIAGLSAQAALAQSSMLPGILGRWTTLPDLVPINPVHVALMRNGKVLIVSGSGNVATNTNFETAVWDPVNRALFTQLLAWDMFCNGMVTLPDGQVFINGGNLRYDPFFGEPRNSVFDPLTGLFTDVENMAHGRWYPTTTVLASLSFQCAASSGCDSAAHRGQSSARELRAPHGDLLSRVSVQPGWRFRCATHDHGCSSRCGQLWHHVPGADSDRGRHRVGRAGPTRCSDPRV